MAVQVQFRRGTKAQHEAFTGATAEVTVNTTDKSLVVHDGTTQGGFAAARADATNLDFTGLAGVTTFTSVAIHNGTINNTTIGIGTSANGNFTNVNFVDGQVGSALSVGAATTFKELLVVNGDARITGILTVGTSSIIIDGDNEKILFGGSEINGDGNINAATGIATYLTVDAGTLDAGANLYAVAGVVTTLTATNATTADLNVTADARVGAALTVTGDATFQSDIFLGDDDKLRLGDGEDLQIWHSGTNSFISDAGTGNLFLAGDNSLFITNVSASENKAVFTTNGSVDLYYDNSKTFETTAYGIDVTGTTGTDNLAVSGVSTFTGTIDVDGQAIFDDITVSAASTFAGEATFQSNVSLGDGDALLLGDSNDLQIVHDGSNSYITDAGTGNLNIDSTGGNIQIRVNSNESAIVAKQDGAVDLYYDNAKKFETTAYGVDVTGTTGTDNLAVSGVSTFTGTATFQSNVDLGDNDRLRLGDGNDLQIYHDGSDSYILDNGTGKLRLASQGSAVDIIKDDGENLARFITDGAVELYYDNSKKFETTTYGVDVTGTTGTDGLIVSGVTTTTGTLDANGNVTVAGTLDVDGQGIFDDITVSAASTFVGNVIAQGNVTINGDLVVEGTQTIINVDQLDVQDKTVGVASTSTASNTTANGGGFFVHGGADGDKEILWQSDTASYEVNQSWLPSADNSYDLGASSQEWRNLYLDGTANIDSLVADTADINGGTIDGATIGGSSAGSGAFTTISASGDITANGNIVGDSSTNISGISSVTASTFFGDGSGLSNTGASLSAASGDQRVVLTSLTTGTMTSAATEAALAYNATSNTLTAGTFSGSGASLTSIPNGALDNSTISGVSLGSNLNTLTMSVSGTGLSGSQTYNGSGAATFTVTSNATNANTASTIVARDASGNFSAGTITAALSGNASTSSSCSGNAATATTLQTARTINGVSFNGSANITVEPYIDNDESTAATRYLTFSANSTAGFKRLYEDSSLTYNPSTNTLTAGTFSGSGASLTSIPNGALTNSTISGVSLGSNLNTLTRGSYLTGSNYNGSSATTWAVDATSANTASKVVARDGSGNFSAGTITATLSGNATTATTATNANNINVADESSDTTCNVVFTTGATGNLAPKTGTNLTFNSANGTLSATTFSGSGASLSGVNAATLDSIDSTSFLRSDAADSKTSGDLQFNDGIKCTFGTGNDLQIYHDGSNSYIDDAGSGNLFIRSGSTFIRNNGSETCARFTENGSVDLYYDNSKKFETTSGGVTITGTATATQFDATSDIKLKENVTTIENGLDKVSQLRGVEFDFKSDGKHSLGVIAQEVEEVLPDLVSEMEDGTKTVAYANLTAVLIEAVKELKAEVAELRSRLDG